MAQLKGLTKAENDLLHLVCALRPWGRDRLSKRVAAFLDGDDDALADAPMLQKSIEAALAAAEITPTCVVFSGDHAQVIPSTAAKGDSNEKA